MDERILIVGAGPAGQAAALTLAGAGVPVAVIDEQPRAGGQILRRPPAGAPETDWIAARAYAPTRRLLARFEAAGGIDRLHGRSAIGLARDPAGWRLTLAGGDGVEELVAPHVLVATGCQDLAVPLPGWTLPGVYPAGGLQTLLKTRGRVPGRRVVLAGTHPLLLILGHQLLDAGVEVTAVLFAQPRASLLRGAGAGPAALRRLVDLGAAVSAMAALGGRVRFGTGPRAIVGRDMVEAVETDADTIACNTVALGYGFVPQAALPRMAGAAMRSAGPAGGFACVAGAWMESSLPGLWVAGETAGVAGALAAAAEGEIAALGILRALGRIDAREAAHRAASPRRAQRIHRRFAAMLDAIADPTGLFPPIADDTPVCRCECVPLAAIRAATGGANAVKLATRCGMGLCQGRNCEPTLLRLLGDSADPGFTARFPARPVAIGDLAAPA